MLLQRNDNNQKKQRTAKQNANYLMRIIILLLALFFVASVNLSAHTPTTSNTRVRKVGILPAGDSGNSNGFVKRIAAKPWDTQQESSNAVSDITPREIDTGFRVPSGGFVVPAVIKEVKDEATTNGQPDTKGKASSPLDGNAFQPRAEEKEEVLADKPQNQMFSIEDTGMTDEYLDDAPILADDEYEADDGPFYDTPSENTNDTPSENTNDNSVVGSQPADSDVPAEPPEQSHKEAESEGFDIPAEIVDKVEKEQGLDIPQQIPDQNIPQQIPDQNIPQQNPDQNIPQQHPDQNIPQQNPDQNIPQQNPDQNIPQIHTEEHSGFNIPADVDTKTSFNVEPILTFGSTEFKTQQGPPQITERQQKVRDAMKWAWKGYKEYSWGLDELQPKSRRGHDWFGLGLTLIDALDTLYIMQLTDEFNEAREWIQTSFNFDDRQRMVNLFETTIRVLGGLLSTYAISKDKLFLDKATDLCNRLMGAFASPTAIPFSDAELQSAKGKASPWGSSSTSEVTSIQLEFRYLSYLTGNNKYREAADKVSDHVAGLPKKDGLVPYFINPRTGQFSQTTYTLGARADSYYEYLLKQWIQTGKTETKHRKRYEEAVRGIRKHLIKRTTNNEHTYVAELSTWGNSVPKMDHLVCFLPGTLALGYMNGLGHSSTDEWGSDLDLAKALLDTCVHLYSETPTFLAPEIAHFDMFGKWLYIKPQDSHYLLRPETIESLFILYRITGDTKYQEYGWKIFEAIEKHARISTGGYASIHSVLKDPPQTRDKMESFFLGETLKYFYLLFGEDASLIPLDKFVLNTEAHPMPIFEWSGQPPPPKEDSSSSHWVNWGWGGSRMLF